ncbi:hypothetical protein [Herbiconiux daphne]|uniref:DUF222 domain-containing protein n=1 Tax=Herbiconiux daphne TaxID=2970914 RepID=A0ABT2H0H3_9MICO|nr:hypothetical protein [Herbiconiux daphne]MCS5733450.1 hypothetical protein [Herbiconiux daphne]
MEISRPDLDEIASQLIDCFGVPTGRLSDDDLLNLAAAAERLARVIGAAQTLLAGEIGSRSRPELGDEGLSRSQNFTTPVKLLAAVTKVSPGEARRRLELGVRLRGAELLGGAVGPAPYPLVSSAMTRGDLSVETAGVISRECAGLAQRGVDPSAVGAAEETLVDSATDPALTADDIARLRAHPRDARPRRPGASRRSAARSAIPHPGPQLRRHVSRAHRPRP